MKITPELLKMAFKIKDQAARTWAQPINDAFEEFGIRTDTEIAYYLAQLAHESCNFSRTREIWGPTPAQKRYEGRKDLGNIHPGDGSVYRGRGLVQITGRANYERLSKDLGIDCVKLPSLLEQPVNAARSAGWFWEYKDLARFAFRNDFRGMTRAINGGYNGMKERLDKLVAIQEAMRHEQAST